MHSFFWFLLASGLTLGLLMLPYRLFLSRLTHFRWNRFYLLSVLGLSLLLTWPGSSLDMSGYFSGPDPIRTSEPAAAGTAVAPPEAVAQGPDRAFTLSPFQDQVLEENVVPDQEVSSGWSLGAWVDPILYGLLAIYLVGLSFFLFKLAVSVGKVLRLSASSQVIRRQGYSFVYPDHLPSSFSFFRLLFLSPNDRNSEDRPWIEAHERAHIRQWHSLDVILAELAICTWWFLPWSRSLKRFLRETHEFLADEAAGSRQGKVAYSRLLLSRTLSVSRPLPVHYFAQSKTQKRILMLHRTRSHRSSRWAYTSLIPVVLLAMVLMACMPAPVSPAEEQAAKALTFAGEPLPDNPVFEAGLEKVMGKLKSNPEYCHKLSLRGARYQKEIAEMLSSQGVHPDFFYLAVAESALDPEANSSMGACGVWQFLPATAESYGMKVSDDLDERKDVARSTLAAGEYLNKYQSEFGTWTAAALAFNRGPKVLRETEPGKDLQGYYKLDHDRGYLYTIIAIKQLFESPETYGIETGPEFGLPLAKTEVSSTYGPRKSPFDGKIKNHNGVDFKAPLGTEVLAISDGTVAKAETDATSKNGHLIELTHTSPLSSRYHHLDEVRVKPGQKVKKGEVIGTVGNTGLSTAPHLHLEIREKDVPVDPSLYIRY